MYLRRYLISTSIPKWNPVHRQLQVASPLAIRRPKRSDSCQNISSGRLSRGPGSEDSGFSWLLLVVTGEAVRARDKLESAALEDSCGATHCDSWACNSCSHCLWKAHDSQAWKTSNQTRLKHLRHINWLSRISVVMRKDWKTCGAVVHHTQVEFEDDSIRIE